MRSWSAVRSVRPLLPRRLLCWERTLKELRRNRRHLRERRRLQPKKLDTMHHTSTFYAAGALALAGWSSLPPARNIMTNTIVMGIQYFSNKVFSLSGLTSSPDSAMTGGAESAGLG